MALQQRMNQLLDAGHRHFVLNLAAVAYVDSFGLGQLISIWTSVQKHSGEMSLCQPTEHVRKLLQITKLDSVFRLEAACHASPA
jgi:anti-sigma B factor antagonist